MLDATTTFEVDKLLVTNQLLNEENCRLTKKLMASRSELAALRGEDVRQAEMALLAELSGSQSTGCDPGVASSRKSCKTRKVQRGHGPTPQQCESKQVVHALPADQMKCVVCGKHSLEPMGSQAEKSEEITVTVSRVVKLEHLRMKYRCRCNASVVTAPGPVKLVPGGRYSVDFAVHTAVSKVVDHLPLHRQVKILKRQGLQVTSQTLWDQQQALAQVLEPTHRAIRQRILEADYLHADETGFLLTEGKKKHKQTLWSISTPKLAWYTMSRKDYFAGKQVLGGYSGTIVADGYQVYEQLARDGPGRLANCWAHVLRKFRDLKEHRPKECAEILRMIRWLYRVERFADRWEAAGGDLRARLRARVSRKITRKIRAWAFEQAALPRSDFGRAVRYMLGRWEGLTRFVGNARLPLDNNAAERSLRGPVLGRKNYLQFRSTKGCQVGSILFSLCESAKLQGVDPHKYLKVAALRAIQSPGTVTLPDDF